MRKNIWKKSFDSEEYLEYCQKGDMKKMARRITRRKLKENLKKEEKIFNKG